MRKQIIRNRKARYGGMTVLLTVLLIAVVVLFNALFSTLAKRYSWYARMTPATDLSVTESCYTLLGSVLEGSDADVQLIFCDTEANLKASATSHYVYETATAVAERFPDRIHIQCHDIWLNPNTVRQYTTTLNPATGEMVPTALKSTNIIVTNGSYYRVYDLTEFFVFEGGDTSKLWAYNGEKKLAAGILHAVETDAPVVCLTNNHSERFYDYELLYLLDDAGYSIRYIDLYQDPIPENCSLIISFNPDTDLAVDDGVSATSEIEILNNFLSTPGHSFLTFLGDGTRKLPNFESFLAEWGVDTCYYTSNANNASYRYMVQDPTQSLTSDGYTIYGEPATEGRAAELVSGLTRGTVFKNSTALRAANGFVNNGDGSYTNGDRTMYSLFQAGPHAVSWANGAPVDNGEAILYALTEQKNAGGSSYVGVSASVDVVTESFLQSAVYGNTDTVLHLLRQLGKTHTPEGLTLKPFQSTGKISTITTAQMWRWTLILAVVPAVVITAAAVLILVRRRRT